MTGTPHHVEPTHRASTSSARLGGLVRLRIDLAYEGTFFRGWALQPGQRTVQGELRDALATVLRLPVTALNIIVAGRTDAGVHARGQVCHVDVADVVWESIAVGHRVLSRGDEEDRARADALARRLRGLLAGDI